MARRRHTPEQVVRKLREADPLLAEGKNVEEVARHLQISEQTYHRWRAQFGGMKADDVRRMKDLDVENTQLKRIVADKELGNLAFRAIAKDAPRTLVRGNVTLGRSNVYPMQATWSNAHKNSYRRGSALVW